MIKQTKKRQRGASIVHWIIALAALLGFGALAIDLNTVYVSQAQLQNAADAGALEGARLLYCRDGSINHAGTCTDASGNSLPTANNAARDAALANVSQGDPVEIISVERGHWEFRTSFQDPNTGIERGGLFTANSTTTPAELVDSDGDLRSFSDLNTDPDEINAVRVVTGRVSTPVIARFAQLLGITSFPVRASAVAYVGFAGTINPGEVDAPLALCREYITGGCNVGRMISQNEQTGGWTNLQQPGGESGTCSGAASADEVNDLITDCFGGINSSPIIAGWDMQTTNGQVQNAFSKVYDCYNKNTVGQGANTFPGRLSEFDTNNDGQPDLPWKWTVPVIDCSDGITGSCNMVLGAVQVDVIWMFDSTNNTGQLNTDAPWKMTRTGPDGTTISWDAAALACNPAAPQPGCIVDPNNGEQRWNSFAATFNLVQPDGSPAVWRQKSLYFAPDCEPTDLIGNTGGSNFGVRSAVPVLVY